VTTSFGTPWTDNAALNNVLAEAMSRRHVHVDDLAALVHGPVDVGQDP
jgi:hypothetical protein